MSRWFLAVLFTWLGTPLLAAESVDYLRDVKPLLKERCFSCHGALKQKAKLRLDTVALAIAGGAIVPGDPTASPLLDRVTEADAATRMPPEGKPLTAEQVAKLKTWVQGGAQGPPGEKAEEDPTQHWAFRPPIRPTLPAITTPEWGTNPIDRFVAAEQVRHNLKPAAEADKVTLLRRVYLDLIGLPPTRDELHSFLADTSPDAYEQVVDRLLASPQYGERWGRRWMDIWRYSDWYGRRSVPDVLNSYGQVWRWRDWIVRSLNADRGYDEMVRLMLAADELAPTADADQVATGFVVRNFFRWNSNNWMRDNVEHTGKAFLGLTLNCCHCHDHKYDPITQEEYFRFRAVFEPIEVRHDRWPGEPDPGAYPKYQYGASYKPITSGMVRVMDEKPNAQTLFYTGGDERNIAKGRPPVPPGVPAALGGTFHVEPVSLPDESWYPGLKPFVRQDELARRDAAIRSTEVGVIQAMRSRNVAAMKIAATQWTAAKSDRAALLARIAADDVAYRGASGDPNAAAGAASRAERQHASDVADVAVAQAEAALSTAKTAAVQKQLATAKATSDAARKALTTASTRYSPLSPVYPKTSSGRRSALARWITNRDNPLTARVAVNHIWAGHFGRPLVETTSNFGRSGQPPTHPALLDWLAVELMERGWRTKPLHRLIVTSRAYRSHSRGDTANATVDPDNVYLWAFPTNRLEAEAVRDSLLHVAGELDLTAGGPDIPQDQGQTSRRRSLYFTHHGEARMEFLDLFDAANPCDAYRRTTSVLPQQALALTNSELALRLSRKLAGKLPTGSDMEFVRAAFEQVLGRPPRANEPAAAMRFLGRQQRARENLVLALFNHTDFVTVR